MDIKITSGKVVVVDPCFAKDYRSMGTVISLSNGDYTLTTSKVKLKLGIGEESYLKDVTMVKKGVSATGLEWHDAGGFEVDSGLGGFFDESIIGSMSEDEYEGWYYDELIAVENLDTFHGNRVAVSPTAFGDGAYDVQVAKKGSDVVGVRMVFVTEHDIEFYNTPTLGAGRSTVIYHTSNLAAPLYEVPYHMSRRRQFVSLTKGKVFGVIDFEERYETDTNDINTVLAKFKTPKDGKLAKIFRLSESKEDVRLVAGSFSITDKTILSQLNGDVNRLLSIKPRVPTNLNYIKFDAPEGTYSIALDCRRDRDSRTSSPGYVVAIRISGD